MIRSVGRRSVISVAAMLGLVAAAMLGIVLFGNGSTARASQEPYVELVQPSRTRVGEQVTIKLVANNVTNLAGFQSTVQYDPVGLSIGEVALENDLERSGRDIFSLGPVGNEGVVTFGAATCPTADCTAAQAWQAVKVDQGVDGRVNLAAIAFQADAPGRYAVTLTGVQLVDPNGNVLPITTVNTIVEVVQ